VGEGHSFDAFFRPCPDNQVAQVAKTMNPNNPLLGENRLKLGVFGFNGQAPSNTMLDELYTPSWQRILSIGATADAAGFEALVPFARWKHGRIRDAVNTAAMDVFDPYVWAAGLSQATSHPAVMATSHMSLIHPVIVAKQAATIDHISNGRFALNVVAGWNEPEFRMFGGTLAEHTDRYAQAAEWMEVLKRLWCEQDEFDFDGQYYSIKKGESFPKPIQKPFPPIMSAGGSDKGRLFAAKYADMCFTLIRSDEPEGAKNDVDAFRDLARREFGRDIHVWTVCYVIQRDTQAEADAYQQRILDNADNRANDAMMAMLGTQSKMMSKEAFLAFRNRYIAGAGGFPLVGTAERIVDRCRRLSEAGVDGLLLCWIDYADGLARWSRDVMPMLEGAGLRRAFAAPK
jgi:dimethylsulfone monooxygenase